MAIINSITLGKASGKLKDMIFAYYDKRTIVRALNTSISTTPTQLQINSQIQYKNCLLAYSMLKISMSNYKYACKRGETILNKFINLTKTSFSTTLAQNASYAIKQLSNRSFNESNWIQIVECNNVQSGTHTGGTEILFINRDIEYTEGLEINLFCIDSETGEALFYNNEITQSEYSNQVMYVDKIQNGNDQSVCYISSEKVKRDSNIYFSLMP